MGVPEEKVTIALRAALDQIDYAMQHETNPEARQHLRDARRSLWRVYAWHGVHPSRQATEATAPSTE